MQETVCETLHKYQKYEMDERSFDFHIESINRQYETSMCLELEYSKTLDERVKTIIVYVNR